MKTTLTEIQDHNVRLMEGWKSRPWNDEMFRYFRNAVELSEINCRIAWMEEMRAECLRNGCTDIEFINTYYI